MGQLFRETCKEMVSTHECIALVSADAFELTEHRGSGGQMSLSNELM